jgi:hypothetical protein
MLGLEGPPKKKALAAAAARAIANGGRGASDTDHNTVRVTAAMLRSWTVDKFLQVVEVRT